MKRNRYEGEDYYCPNCGLLAYEEDIDCRRCLETFPDPVQRPLPEWRCEFSIEGKKPDGYVWDWHDKILVDALNEKAARLEAMEIIQDRLMEGESVASLAITQI